MDAQTRQKAIEIMAGAMVQAGLAPEDAAKMAPVLVDKSAAGEKTL